MRTVTWQQLTCDEKYQLLQRPLLENTNEVRQQVTDIIAAVKQLGDTACYQFSEQFDRVKLSELIVTDAEFSQAQDHVSTQISQAIGVAAKNIAQYHQAQRPAALSVSPCLGVTIRREYRAIERVGLYIPGGTAPLVSTVLMLAIPAKIAGCEQIVLATPASKDGRINPAILVAAAHCGVTTVIKLGGAQAVAALAYGTESVPKVDKIFGPGNRFVTEAKLQVSRDPHGASLDLPAGPSELLVIADDSADPEFVAADLLSQAEHGVDSQVLLVCLSANFATRVTTAINSQLKALSRQQIAQQALTNASIIIVESIAEAITISNDYAPEHLSLNIAEPDQVSKLIKSAGTVFMGGLTTESFGDYTSGSNHVLPTYGYARTHSGLGLMDFMRSISFQTVNEQGVQSLARATEILATVEGLDAHKQAASIRLARLNHELL